MFNDESGKLEWFELKEIWYLTDGTMKILGSLPSGDFKCTTNRLFRLYETPEKFKDNNYYDVKCVYPSFNNVTAFRNSEATGCVYMFNDDGFVEKTSTIVLYYTRTRSGLFTKTIRSRLIANCLTILKLPGIARTLHRWMQTRKRPSTRACVLSWH